ncbi:MAG TPA: ABC transporter permease [Candidatus Sulfotelmatobacter sp.]|nr:ABC transporter permease [Candidatus Sulfotelmatobacter sp.]
MSGLAQDLRYALRQLRKSPAFTAVAVTTLALGIGANTAVFSVMNAVLLRSLPVRDPQNLYYVQIGKGQDAPPSVSSTGDGNKSFSEPVFEALRERSDVFADLIAYAPLSPAKVAVRYGDSPEEAEGEEVSGNFFSGLTAQIVRGRGFTLEEERQHAPVAVISDTYWNRRFGHSPSVLGSTIFVKSVPLTIIGISAPGFYGVEPGASTDFWIPLQSRPELNAWGESAASDSVFGAPKWWCLQMMARLRENITPAQAEANLESTFGAAAKIGIGNIDPKKWKPVLDFDPAKGIQNYKQQYRDQVHILMGLVLLVLLIACTNVSLLLMARNEARQREYSLKMAIGADSLHVFRQLLTESSLLVAAGAALGWIFAVFATRALAAWSQIESGLSPDRNVLMFTLAVSALIALAFGLAPLWSALRAPISGVLRATSTGLTTGHQRRIGGRVLMSSQVAICLLLLVAASLLLRTLRQYQTQDLGMKTEGLVVFGVTPQHARTAEETLAFFRNLLDRVRALPGVQGVTMMNHRLGSGWGSRHDEDLDGASLQDRFGSRGTITTNDVGPDCFHVLGVPILEGRDVSDADTPASPPVAVVNETFAKRFLPNTSPLGHKLKGDRTIVGVVRDSKYRGVSEESLPMAYYPALQKLEVGETVHFEVRSDARPLALLPTIAKAVHEIDPNVPLEEPVTQQGEFEISYSQPAMFARLAGFFGVLAAVLVATGLYGTLAYRTNRRTTEIGMRMALGAQRTQVIWMIMRESLVISSVGVLIGLPLALACARFLDSMLYQVSDFDPVSFVLAVCAIALVGSLAAFVPARRAAKVDPMVALRYE